LLLEFRSDSTSPIQRTVSAALLLVAEGANDVEFLIRLAQRLRVELADVPDLGALIDAGQLVIVPAGGGDPVTWVERLSPLGLPQFHLYDREQEPHTTARQRAIAKINRRPGCRAALLAKRSLKNYLHPAAILAADGPELCFDDDEAVAMLVAEKRFGKDWPDIGWDCLSRRAQHRLAYAAKRWLNRSAVEQMTAALLAERDPAGELLRHLRTICSLTGDPAAL
jgi:hypothetical protein